MSDFLSQLTASLRVADLLDVALVAAFLYVFLTWLRRDASPSTSRRIMVVTAIFAGVYLLANFVELYLVKRLVEVLFIAFLLAAIVVFQSDIRRMLDRVGTWSFFRRSSPEDASTQTIDTLTEAAAHMAESKTGALIAVRGREPWEGHIQGGVSLKGKVSAPLLYSIFHPGTAGHDGVVLLEGEEITTFAAHLPLAQNLPEASDYGGTRHAAALGLAEQCDAFVIVVSEERGTISVAQDGQLSKLDSANELKERLGQFWQQHYSQPEPSRPTWWSQPSAQTALASVVLATLLWFLFAYQPGTVYRTLIVPIEYRNLKANWALDNPGVTEAKVSLSGSEQAFRLLDPTRLAVSFDLSNAEVGANQLTVTETTLKMPEAITLYDVEPRTVDVTLQKLDSVRVPVQVQTTGALPDSLQLARVTSKPASVVLMTPQNGTHPQSVPTVPIDLSRFTSSTSITSKLVPPSSTHLASDQNAAVKVNLEVHSEQSRDASP